MKMAVRSVLLFLAVALLLHAPDAYAIDGCYVCKMVVARDGSYTYTYCDRPEAGSWGSNRCIVESYGSYTYCQDYGDPCCIDPIYG